MASIDPNLAAVLVARYHPAMTAARKPQDPAKFARYRERMKARGLKEVRLWVQDPDAPGFRERLAADIARINASPAEREFLKVLEAAAAEIPGWTWDEDLPT